MELQADIVLSAVNLELLRISQVWNSGVFAGVFKPTTFFQPLIWSLLGLAKFGVGKFSQRIYKPTPSPTAVHLELFQISRGWNSGAFAEDLQADNFLSAVNLEPF